MYLFKYIPKLKSEKVIGHSVVANSLSEAKRKATMTLRYVHTECNRIEIYRGRHELAYRHLSESYWTNVYTYSDFDVTRDEVEYRLEYDNPNKLSEDELYKQCYTDDFLYVQAWEDFVETVGQLLEKLAPSAYVHIEGKNLGWRGLSGEMYIELPSSDPIANAKHLLRKLICSADSNIRMESVAGKALYFNITHHDNPINGDSFTVTAMSPTAYQKAA
ncbi:MAG: hypothetical protein LBV04_08500 [Deferribacteraceae bacterium]|jgi:hypothetical protein|nr:hypothetical protein [Deferribacteraceae bacterium]